MRCLITSRTVGFLRRPAHRLPGNPEKQISMRVSEGANDLEKPAELHLQYLPEAPDALANGQSNAVVNSVGALQYFISKRQPTNRNCNLGPVLSRARATSACRRPRVNLEFVPRARRTGAGSPTRNSRSHSPISPIGRGTSQRSRCARKLFSGTRAQSCRRSAHAPPISPIATCSPTKGSRAAALPPNKGSEKFAPRSPRSRRLTKPRLRSPPA
jgi:hypothetical protein